MSARIGDLRVKSFRSRDGWDGYQILQERRWWGWKTIEREDVPSHVIISMGAFGDTGGWVSSFGKYGTFGRDGRINLQ